MIIELQRFLTAVSEGNITRAAEKVFITQSALTQSIQRLEKELQTKLFIQKGKKLVVTDDGKIVVEVSRKILQLWENAKNKQLRVSSVPLYSIGMFDNAAISLSSFITTAITQDNYKLELTIDNSTKLLTLLKLGILDAAICVTPHENLDAKQIQLLQTYREELIPVSSKTYKLNIAAIPFIFYNKHSHTRKQTDAVFAKNNISPRIFAESTSATFMKELAIQGNGVALLPKNFIAAELKQGILKKQRLPFAWSRSYGVYINNQSSLDKNHGVITGLLRELQGIR